MRKAYRPSGRVCGNGGSSSLGALIGYVMRFGVWTDSEDGFLLPLSTDSEDGAISYILIDTEDR